MRDNEIFMNGTKPLKHREQFAWVAVTVFIVEIISVD